MGQVPLERALSKLGIVSRAQTKRLVEAGRITVNGQVIRDPAFRVVPEKVRITVDGKSVARAAFCTIMLYKPRGVVTTKSDEKGRKSVYDLLPEHLRHLHPVGRLDMATTGLLLMTTDTQLSHFLTCPDNNEWNSRDRSENVWARMARAAHGHEKRPTKTASNNTPRAAR